MDHEDTEKQSPSVSLKPLMVHPGYAFSGANMAGESLQVCLACRSLVKDSDRYVHKQWHEQLGC